GELMIGYNVLVIGAGLAGLTTACLLAQAGKKVLLVAEGAGALLLAPGCIDVLGYQPAGSKTPVERPLDKLPAFLADWPDHPYRLLGAEAIEAGLQAFAELARDSGLDYRGQAERNWLLPGPAGAVHPTCLAPAAMAAGDLRRGGRMLIVGFHELRDFYPALIGDNLNAQKLGVRAGAASLEAPPPISGRPNATPIDLARAFETEAFRQEVVRRVKSKARGYGRVGFPAVLGLERHAGVVADLQRQLGKPVFEISTLPPSVPGRRLFEALRRAFQKAGGRFILGGRIVEGRLAAGRADAVRLETAARLKTIRAGAYVLATGGVFGGGLQTDAGGRVWEPIFGLPVVADGDRRAWFEARFLAGDGHPLNRYGLRVNEHLNPVDEGGQPVAANLFVVGSALAGSDWTRGRTGDGLAVATAASVAGRVGAGEG
ncbi:MAG: glycerol-3-phosphate dehydrogenase subunit GlpB, partial [Anaerolineae bacterium]